MTLYCRRCGAPVDTRDAAILPSRCSTCGAAQLESAEAHFAREAVARDVEQRQRAYDDFVKTWQFIHSMFIEAPMSLQPHYRNPTDGTLHRHAGLEPGFIVWTEEDREFLRELRIAP